MCFDKVHFMNHKLLISEECVGGIVYNKSHDVVQLYESSHSMCLLSEVNRFIV